MLVGVEWSGVEWYVSHLFSHLFRVYQGGCGRLCACTGEGISLKWCCSAAKLIMAGLAMNWG